MNAKLLRLAIAVAEGEPPSEFRVFAQGTTQTESMHYLFDEVSAAMVMQAYERQGNDLFVDYEHKSLDPWAPPGAGKAAGWFRPEMRDGECWAVDVRWTIDAAESLRKREWRYFSPAALIDTDTGRILELINVGLTNMPATLHMEPLMASRDALAERALARNSMAAGAAEATKEKDMKELLAKLLGLADSATDAEVFSSARARIEAAGAANGAVQKVLDAAGAKSVDEAVGILIAGREAATKLQTVIAELAKANGRIETVEREALIATAEDEGKITPALREWAKSVALDVLKGFLDKAPALTQLARGSRPSNDDAREPAPRTNVKPYEEMSSEERHNLFVDSPRLFHKLRAEAKARKRAPVAVDDTGDEAA
jgi:phage I-like protein